MINILVVEDDAKPNQIVCRYINDSGYAAKGCLNPHEAYKLMYGQPFDLIISDIMMPGIDGFEFAETVRNINKTVPILFMTAREFNILYKLLSYPGKTISRAQLADEFWDIESDTRLQAVDVYITKLRDKFDRCDGFQIVTARGLDCKAVQQ